MDEPKHPRFREYVHGHTRAWSETVDASDAFVFVMPEYNYGINAPLKNAIDYLHQEWHDKPVAFVSYGGIAAGTRAVQMTKQIVSAVKMLRSTSRSSPAGSRTGGSTRPTPPRPSPWRCSTSS